MPSPRWYFTSAKDTKVCSACAAHDKNVKATYVLICTYNVWPNTDDLRDTIRAPRENRVYRCALHAPKCDAHAKERDARKK